MSNALIEKEGIGIQNIHMRFISNISPDTMNKLTRNMFYLPGDKEESDDKIASNQQSMNGGENIQNNVQPEATTDNEYPYFTDTSRLNVDKLNKLARKDLLDVFFDKKLFKKHIGLTKTSNKDIRKDNAHFNFNAMMKLLLCTTYPIKHNIKNTFSENINQVASNSQNDTMSALDMIKNIVTTPSDNYCYFTINGTKSTLLSVTHINDLINDKSFDNTLNTIYAFKQWRNNKIKKLEDEKSKLDGIFDKAFENKFSKMQEMLKTDAYKTHISALAKNPQLSLPRSLLQPYLENLKSNTDKKNH